MVQVKIKTDFCLIFKAIEKNFICPFQKNRPERTLHSARFCSLVCQG